MDYEFEFAFLKKKPKPKLHLYFSSQNILGYVAATFQRLYFHSYFDNDESYFSGWQRYNFK